MRYLVPARSKRSPRGSAALCPEDVGGLGGSGVEAAIVAEELGRALVLEPFLAVGVLAAEAINRVGSTEQREAMLPPILSGESLTVLAHSEQAAGGEVGYVETTAERNGGGWRLRGVKTLVLAGPAADTFLASARTAGEAGDQTGVTVFALPASREGLSRRDYRTNDGLRACDLHLEGVQATAEEVLGEVGGAVPGLRDAHARAIAVLCAEAVGVMDQALWTTRDYLTTRKQFGVPISSFQVLQHRASDMYVAVEQSRAAALRVLAHLDDPPAVRDAAASSAKVQVGRSGHFVCGQAIQLHGGIAVTDEYVIGHRFKRMMMIEQFLGHTQQHLVRLAARLGGFGLDCKTGGCP